MGEEKTIKIKGMHCRSCEVLLSEVLSDFEGMKVVSADYKKGILKVSSDGAIGFPAPKIKAAIEAEGYKVESI